MDIFRERTKMPWPVLAFLDFVVIVGFDDILYPLQNQGLSVVFNWVLIILLFALPYEMVVAQLGSTFDSEQDGGLASWMRRSTHSDFLGYCTAWIFWASCMPYIVDVANSAVVSISWTILGNDSLNSLMSNTMFGLLTFAIIFVFILGQNLIKNSLEIISAIAALSMFLMTMLFVGMTGWAVLHGAKIATHPFNLKAFIPTFDAKYWSSTGLLMFAAAGAEVAVPYISKLRNPNRELPKAMILLAILTSCLTVLGTLALAMFFNANHLPHDLKMNGSYYAFQLLGQRMGWGKSLMYIFAVVQALYMFAQLAVFLDAVSWVLAGDTDEKYMPKWMLKRDKNGRPIHSYYLTAGVCLFLLLMSGTLPDINSVFNWLLNLNGIVNPFKNCFIFIAFIMVRLHQEEFNSGFVFVKNRTRALIVGWFCLLLSFTCAMMAFLPQEVSFGTHAWNSQLLMNIFTVIVLFGLGLIFPLLAKLERRYQTE